MGAEVAVRVHCDLAVRMTIDGQTTEFSLARADTYMQWVGLGTFILPCGCDRMVISSYLRRSRDR